MTPKVAVRGFPDEVGQLSPARGQTHRHDHRECAAVDHRWSSSTTSYPTVNEVLPSAPPTDRPRWGADTPTAQGSRPHAGQPATQPVRGARYRPTHSPGRRVPPRSTPKSTVVDMSQRVHRTTTLRPSCLISGPIRAQFAVRDPMRTAPLHQPLDLVLLLRLSCPRTRTRSSPSRQDVGRHRSRTSGHGT
jgi:hypothetical protein